jgi:hypothetical protein
MDKFLLIIIIFLSFYIISKCFKVIEGHSEQSNDACSSAENRVDCRKKAPSCYWSTDTGGRMPTVIFDGETVSGSCRSTGSTSSPSSFHMGNHHSEDQENPDETPNLNRSNNWQPDTIRPTNAPSSIYCDSFTCPSNTEKRESAVNIEKGNNPFQTCCRSETCDRHTCPIDKVPKENSSTIEKGNNPNENCCENIKCGTAGSNRSSYQCVSPRVRKGDNNWDDLEVEAQTQLDQICCDSNCDSVTNDMCMGAVTTVNALTDEEGVDGIQENLYLRKNNDQNVPQGTNQFDSCCIPKLSKNLKCKSYKCPHLKFTLNNIDYGINLIKNENKLNELRGIDPVNNCCVIPFQDGDVAPQGIFTEPDSNNDTMMDNNQRANVGILWNAINQSKNTCTAYDDSHTKDQALPTSDELCRLELYDNGIHSTTRESNLETNTER